MLPILAAHLSIGPKSSEKWETTTDDKSEMHVEILQISRRICREIHNEVG
jgi:hypothetical protein